MYILKQQISKKYDEFLKYNSDENIFLNNVPE